MSRSKPTHEEVCEARKRQDVAQPDRGLDDLAGTDKLNVALRPSLTRTVLDPADPVIARRHGDGRDDPKRRNPQRGLAGSRRLAVLKEVKTLMDRGFTDKEIGVALNLPHGAVSKYKADVRKDTRTLNELEAESRARLLEYKRMREEGMGEIARLRVADKIEDLQVLALEVFEEILLARELPSGYKVKYEAAVHILGLNGHVIVKQYATSSVRVTGKLGESDIEMIKERMRMGRDAAGLPPPVEIEAKTIEAQVAETENADAVG